MYVLLFFFFFLCPSSSIILISRKKRTEQEINICEAGLHCPNIVHKASMTLQIQFFLHVERNSINSNIVLDTCDKIKDILFLILKTSLWQGTFPTKLKIAKGTPLFKSGDTENVYYKKETIGLFQFFQYFGKFFRASCTIEFINT